MKAAKLTLLAVLLVGCFVRFGVRDYVADPLGLHLAGWRRELNLKISWLVYSCENYVHYGQKAVKITCINNMKQIGLSCRLAKCRSSLTIDTFRHRLPVCFGTPLFSGLPLPFSLNFEP
jgi:hypothetical protein